MYNVNKRVKKSIYSVNRYLFLQSNARIFEQRRLTQCVSRRNSTFTAHAVKSIAVKCTFLPWHKGTHKNHHTAPLRFYRDTS